MAMWFLITGGDALVARANLRGATPRPGAYSPPPTCGHHLAPLSAYSLGEDPHEAPAAGTQQARSALASLSSTHAGFYPPTGPREEPVAGPSRTVTFADILNDRDRREVDRLRERTTTPPPSEPSRDHTMASPESEL